MKKVLILLVITISLFFVTNLEVNAYEIGNSFPTDIFVSGDEAVCGGWITQDALDMIQEILNYFRILGPILLIILVALDFAKAVIAQDNDALKKAQSKVISRAIATILLFFVPTITRAILNLDGVKDTIVIPEQCKSFSSRINK